MNRTKAAKRAALDEVVVAPLCIRPPLHLSVVQQREQSWKSNTALGQWPHPAGSSTRSVATSGRVKYSVSAHIRQGQVLGQCPHPAGSSTRSVPTSSRVKYSVSGHIRQGQVFGKWPHPAGCTTRPVVTIGIVKQKVNYSRQHQYWFLTFSNCQLDTLN